MGITGTISAPYARARVKNSRCARTGGAGVRNPFSSYLLENIQLCCAADGDADHRQVLIMAIASASDLDLNLRPITGTVYCRRWRAFWLMLPYGPRLP